MFQTHLVPVRVIDVAVHLRGRELELVSSPLCLLAMTAQAETSYAEKAELLREEPLSKEDGDCNNHDSTAEGGHEGAIEDEVMLNYDVQT